MTIRGRFGFSLLANLSKVVITFGTGLLVARGLGPEQYGKMMFLLTTFVGFRSLLDMGTSTAFFTFLSQRQRSLHFVGWYFAWLGVQFFIPFLAIAFLFPEEWIELVWKGEERSLVIIAFVAAYMQSVFWATVLQMGESQRLTRWVQVVAVLTALIHLFMMVWAFWGGWLTVRWILLLTAIEFSVAVAVTVNRLHFPLISEETDSLKVVVNEFCRYCFPLIPYAWLSFAYLFTDRWLLQNYSGSVQQAYYSVADQFASIATLATVSILNIFWKEIAEAHQQNNHERVTLLYRQVTRGLFFVAALVAGFLAPWAEDILRMTLGAAYVGGTATLMIMFFNPLYQSMGQIGAVMAYATGRVAAYVKIGMVMMALSIIMTYFVLANAESPLPGLELGSVGLAGKVVVIHIISVNAFSFYLARCLGVKFEWLFQPLAILVCSCAGLIVYSLSRALMVNYGVFAQLVTAGIFYMVLTALSLYALPFLVGMSRSGLVNLVRNSFRRATP